MFDPHEITLRQHWHVVRPGLIEQAIEQMLDTEEANQSVRDTLSRHEGVLPVWRVF
jgi:hypothetical protein